MSLQPAVSDAELHQFDPINFEAPKEKTFPLVQIDGEIYWSSLFFRPVLYTKIRVFFNPHIYEEFRIVKKVWDDRYLRIIEEIQNLKPEEESAVSCIRDVIKRHTKQHLEACR